MKRLSLWGAFVLACAAAVPVYAQQQGFVLFPNVPKVELFPSLDTTDPIPDTQVFVHPVTDPYFHEDSFNSTDLRLWYLYHKFADNSLLASGDAQVIAAQVRVGITPNLQLVAYKDGFTLLHPGLSAVHHDGWNDVAAGLKYEFLQDRRDQLYMAVGVGNQFPWGESKALQNKDEIRAWWSFDKGFDRLHFGGTFNYFWGVGEQGAFGTGDHLAAYVHCDYRVCDWFSPVVESSYYHVTRSRNVALPIQGADVTNLGGVSGDDIWALGVGFEIRPIKHVAVRAAWEKNVTHPSDIFDHRTTVSVILSL
jgi:hypothetical protein